jgi:serine/threonine protein kinase/TolB-like protein/Tfp pilus assembly protein PilF
VSSVCTIESGGRRPSRGHGCALTRVRNIYPAAGLWQPAVCQERVRYTAATMVGRRLSHYEIVEEISRGGMGVVYRALDVDLGREVALKVLPEELDSDPERRARLLQEARAASALEHPHIAVIHEVGDSGGTTFVAMELIRGEKLSDIIARGALTVPRALSLATEAAEGLARAHERGIVHRDLKPSNVMVTEDGHAKIIDFGLAKVLEPAGEDQGSTRSLATPLTREGAILGTAAYMAPEQARAGRIDHRADIFALGVTLYEMLSGRAAFQRRSSLDTLQAVVAEPVPDLPPSRETTNEITAEVQRIIRKATAKDPDDRYQGMKDVVVDLRAVRRRLESSEDVSQAVRNIAPARSARRTRQTVPVALAAVIVSAIAAGIWWRRPEAPPPAPSGKPAVAVMYFENNTGDASLDWMRSGLTDMFVTNLSQSADVEVLGTDRLVQILRDLDRADERVISADLVQEIARRARVTNVLVGSYMRAGGTFRISARLQEAHSGRIVTSERVEGAGESALFQLVDDLTDRFRSRLSGARETAPPSLLSRPGIEGESGRDRGLSEVTTSSLEAYRYYAEGMDFHERGQSAEAAPLFQRAIAVDPDFAMAYAKLAVAMHNTGQLIERDRYAEEAIKRVERLTSRERHYIQGFHYSNRTETLREGIEAYKRGLELHPEHQASRHNLGLHYLELEWVPEGIREYEELIRRGTSSPTSYENLVDLHLTAGDLARARGVVEDYWSSWPDTMIGYRMRGIVALVAGDLDTARASYDRAMQFAPADRTNLVGTIVTALLQERWSDLERLRDEMRRSPNPFVQGVGRAIVAGADVARGRMRAAGAEFENALAVRGLAPAPRAAIRNRWATMLLRQGRHAEALTQLELAAPDARGRVPEIETLSLLAIAQHETGTPARSRETLARADALAATLPSNRHLRRIHWARGEIIRRSGDARGALPELTKAVSLLSANGHPLGPPQPHLELLLSAALAHRDAGDTAAAIALLERMVQRHERGLNMEAWVRSLYLLADLYEQRGDMERARPLYKQFLGLWGEGDVERGWVARARVKVGG